MDSIICPNCKSVNTGESLFCQVCGTELPRTIEVPAETAQGSPVPPPVSGPGAAAPVPPPLTSVPPVPAAPQFLVSPISKFGVWIDGWSDVIEGADGHAAEIKEGFLKEMKNAGIEGLRASDMPLSSGNQVPRNFHVIQDKSGATATVRIAPFGKNLLVSWDLYVKRIPNWITIGVLGGVILIFAILASINSFLFNSGVGGILNFFNVLLTWPLVPIIGILIAGKIWKDDPWGYFVKDLDDFALEDAESLAMVVDSALSNTILDVLEEGDEE